MPPPDKEDLRLNGVYESGLLDSLPEDRFDRVVRLATLVLNTPMAAFSLVDRDRQWFKASSGLNVQQTPRNVSFCQHTIATSDGIMIIPDAMLDERFRDNPLVLSEPHIRAYAGIAVNDWQGRRLGALCVLDTQARNFAPTIRQTLEDLKAIIESELKVVEQQAHLAFVERYQEAEASIVQLFRLSDQLMAVLDGNGYLERANPAACRMLNYTSQELTAKPWVDFVHPDDIDETVTVANVMVKSQNVAVHKVRIRHKDGHYIWLQLSGAAAPDGSRIYLVGRNCTDEQKLTDDIKSANHMLSSINDSLSTFVADRTSRNPFEILLESLLQVSESDYGFVGEVILDESGAPFLRSHALTNIAWNDATRLHYQTSVDTGLEFRNLETLFGRVMTSGKVLIANSAPTDERRGGLPEGHPPLNAFLGIPIYSGGVMVGMVGLANRREGYEEALIDKLELLLSTAGNLIMAYQAEGSKLSAQRALANSEALQRVTMDNIADGVATIDESGRLRSSNRALQEMFGLDNSQLLNKTLPDLIDVSNTLQTLTPRHSTSDGGEITERVLSSALHSAGHHFDVEVALSSMQPETGLRCVAVFRDVTEWKKTELELRAAKDQADAANTTKSLFLASMSHEFRTPLNGIVGMSALAMDLAIIEEQRDYLQTVIESSHTLTRLVNDVLDYSKIEANKLTLEHFEFNPGLILENIIDHGILRAQEKGIEFVVDVDDRLPEGVIGDPTRIRQVLLNLIDNAIKYTDHGSIKVEVCQLTEQAEEGVTIHFEVKDTGKGIAAAQKSATFEAFVQANSSDTRLYGGTGLGLAICTSLLQLMGSEMQLETELGIGSAFSFNLKLPLANGKNDSASQTDLIRPLTQSAITNTVAPMRPLLILLAEDNPVNQKVATIILTSRGHTVVLAENGEKAVELAAKQNFDIILMDIQMPGIDGVEATARIRASEVGRQTHVPILALTAHALQGDGARFLAARMDGYLSKPFQVNELLSTVASVVSHSSGE